METSSCLDGVPLYEYAGTSYCLPGPVLLVISELAGIAIKSSWRAPTRIES
jgi:hypothetical protein